MKKGWLLQASAFALHFFSTARSVVFSEILFPSRILVRKLPKVAEASLERNSKYRRSTWLSERLTLSSTHLAVTCSYRSYSSWLDYDAALLIEFARLVHDFWTFSLFVLLDSFFTFLYYILGFFSSSTLYSSCSFYIFVYPLQLRHMNFNSCALWPVTLELPLAALAGCHAALRSCTQDFGKADATAWAFGSGQKLTSKKEALWHSCRRKYVLHNLLRSEATSENGSGLLVCAPSWPRYFSVLDDVDANMTS